MTGDIRSIATWLGSVLCQWVLEASVSLEVISWAGCVVMGGKKTSYHVILKTDEYVNCCCSTHDLLCLTWSIMELHE